MNSLSNLLLEPFENPIRESKEQEGIGSRQILVIEEEQQNAQWLDGYLNLKGYGVSLARNGRDGIHILNTNAICGMILSLDDREEGRMDLVHYVRKYFPDVAIFVMSKGVDSEIVGRLVESGVRGLIVKPIVYDHLQEVVFEFQRQAW